MSDEMQPRTSEENSAKITDWANEPSLRDLKNDFDQAKPAQTTQIGKIKHWNKLMAADNRPKVNNGRSTIQPKLIRRQAEWRYSALTEPFLGSNKLYKVSPVTYEDTEGAIQNDLVLNYQFRTKLNRINFIDTYVRSTVDEGTSITRVGWKRTTIMVKEMVPVYAYYPMTSEGDLQIFQQAMELRNSNPRGYEENITPEIKEAINYYEETGEPTTVVITGEQEVEVEKVIENCPTLEVMNPENVFIDPSCNGDLNKALFIIISFETNKAELMKEPNKYKNLDKVDWLGNSPTTQPDHATMTPQTFNLDSLRRKVVAYEYWGFYDIEGKGYLEPIVATWIGDVMVRMERNPFPDEKLPFVLVPYLPIKRELYGEPDAELLEDNQNILGAVVRGMIDLLARSANSQRGMPKGMMDPLNRRRYERGDDYEYNPLQGNPEQQIIEHKYPELPQSALMMLNLQNQEAESLTGVKSFAGGISGSAYGDVAAGIRGVLDAASKREMAILRRLAKGMQEIGAKIIAMNAVFLSEQEVIRITNEQFVTVNREDLKGNFDLEVDIATAEVDNQRTQDLAFMLQTIGPNLDPTVSMRLLSEIATLKRMPELSHWLKNWQPTPDPVQEQLKQLELENKMLENEELKSKIELNRAQAEKALAEKDKTNLEFVEQETGTKHAREMERQKAQAEGNQQLEVTKALLKPRKEGESRPDIPAAIGYQQISDNLNSSGQQSPVTSIIDRNAQARENPALSLGSSRFNPQEDPALNPSINI